MILDSKENRLIFLISVRHKLMFLDFRFPYSKHGVMEDGRAISHQLSAVSQSF